MNNQRRGQKLLQTIWLILALCFLATGLICLFIGQFCEGDARAALLINALVFAVIGAVFLAISLVFRSIMLNHLQKLRRLQEQGLRYDAEIVNVYENIYMRVNWRHPLIVECVYSDAGGCRHLVKSGNYWSSIQPYTADDLRAVVWVNPDNPRDYCVELSNALERRSEIGYDVDDR